LASGLCIQRDQPAIQGAEIDAAHPQRHAAAVHITAGRELGLTRYFRIVRPELAPGTRIGFDRAEDAKKFLVTEKGVVLVTPDMLAHGHP